MRDYELALTEDRLNDNLRELKGLTIGISRAIDRQNGKRGGSPKRELRPADTLVRNAVAELLRPMRPTANGGVIYEKTAAEMARSLYPSDEALQNFITRAAVSPASTTTTDYAAELVATATIDFLTGGEAPSGFAALARQTLQVPLQGSAKVPSRVYPISLTGAWIGEGAPKPVFTVPLSSTTLSPSKLVSITAWSDEIATWSVPSIEALIRDAVARDIAGLLDSTAFDANAATATRPAGLFSIRDQRDRQHGNTADRSDDSGSRRACGRRHDRRAGCTGGVHRQRQAGRALQDAGGGLRRRDLFELHAEWIGRRGRCKLNRDDGR